ncbi:MAG: hypothetical protein H6821_05215 [Planctomycetaceae bacterium]|nr:hypothetical protein [Planctomycetaceae bacterium]
MFRWPIWRKNRSFRTSFKDIQSQPRRFINSPMWSGLIENGRSYSPFTYNVEADVPWRILTGRQSFYLDHPVSRLWRASANTSRSRCRHWYSDLQFSEMGETGEVIMQFPHAARASGISTDLRQPANDDAVMRIYPHWMNDKDAGEDGYQRQRLVQSSTTTA